MTTAEILLLPTQRRADSELSDQALIASCAVRDSRALAVLYDRHHESIYRFLGRMIDYTSPDLDDLVQSTFLEAWVHAARFRGESNPRTWLFGIAANLARNHHRKKSRRTRCLTVLSFETPPSPPLPDEKASHRQLLDRLQTAIEKLPYKLRVAYVMCDLEGMKGTEAAEALGVRPGTIWRRLHHARRQLREMIGGTS